MRWPAVLALLAGLGPAAAGEPRPAPAGEPPPEEVLGAPAAFASEALAEEHVAVAEGSVLRSLPDPRSAALATVDAPSELAVVERRGAWAKVRYGALRGWVVAGAPGEEGAPAAPAARGADPALLERALVRLGAAGEAAPGPEPGPEPGRLGPFAFHTDLADPGLARFLDRVATDLLRVYRERYALEPGPPPAAPEPAPGPTPEATPEAAEAVVLFAREADYRAFAEAEAALAGLEEGGFAGFGLAALYLGARGREEVASLLVHELTHLLNARTLGPRTPPWLEEGLANDLAFGRIDPSGRLDPGSLGGGSEVMRREVPSGPDRGGWQVTVTTRGGRAALERLAAALDRGELPGLAALTSLTWREVAQPGSRELVYAQSGFFVRYLLASPRRAAGFQAYLRSIAAGGPAEPEELLAALGEPRDALDRLDRGFRRWLRSANPG